MEILHVSSTTTVAGRSSESTNSPFQTWITHGYRRHRSFKLLPYHTWKTNSWNIFWKETLSKRHLLVQFWFSGVYVERSCLFKKAHCSVFTLCTYSFMPCISRFPKKDLDSFPPMHPLWIEVASIKLVAEAWTNKKTSKQNIFSIGLTSSSVTNFLAEHMKKRIGSQVAGGTGDDFPVKVCYRLSKFSVGIPHAKVCLKIINQQF